MNLAPHAGGDNSAAFQTIEGESRVQTIERYWRERGFHHVRAWVSNGETKSNLVNGLPPKNEAA